MCNACLLDVSPEPSATGTAIGRGPGATPSFIRLPFHRHPSTFHAGAGTKRCLEPNGLAVHAPFPPDACSRRTAAPLRPLSSEPFRGYAVEHVSGLAWVPPCVSMIRGVLSPGPDGTGTSRIRAGSGQDSTRPIVGRNVDAEPWSRRTSQHRFIRCRPPVAPLLRCAVIKDHETIDVFIGVDVGKFNHHAVALNRAGKPLLNKALPQDEAKLNALIKSLTKHGNCSWPSSTSRPRSAPWPLRSPGTWAFRSPTCPAWPCGVSLISTRARPRPTPATRSSSPTPPALCPTPCAPSRSRRPRSPSSASSPDSTTTSANSHRDLPTGSAGCSPRPSLPGTGTRQAPRPRGHGRAAGQIPHAGGPAPGRGSPHRCPAAQARTAGLEDLRPGTSSPRWPPRPWSFPAPTRQESSFPTSPACVVQTRQPAPRPGPGLEESPGPTRFTCVLDSMPGVGFRTQAMKILTSRR